MYSSSVLFESDKYFDAIEDLGSCTQPMCPWIQVHTLYIVINVTHECISIYPRHMIMY